MIYENRRTKPISNRRFARRMASHVAMAAGLVGASLAAGMGGYEHFEHLPSTGLIHASDAMLLGGMGPVESPLTNGGKLFAGIYALYSGGVFLVVAGLLLAPVFHRILHRFHWEGELP